MVWVSRLIDQDVNMFVGARLLATSERNLFASGLLPTRVDADVYHALALRNEAASVTRERIGEFEYLVAATPLAVRQQGILTVPLTSTAARHRRAARHPRPPGAAGGAALHPRRAPALGYSMAERISDPVNRLTRATRRIARGDLDARIAATSSDELRRLVEAFNSMAADLQRQRGELERTHRLEAWAEMARQVAHEIKNPLTPIQLNAEHLRRVHADRGEPLSPVLQECVATILTQVKLLRQIASEFSSFASSPTAKPAEVDVAALLHEIVDPYRAGLDGRIRLDLAIPSTLPPVFVDRTLIARSLTNIVENALHAMPGTGTLSVAAAVRRRLGADSCVRHRCRNGRRGAGARVRAVFLDQSQRNRTGAADREAQCGAEWRNDQPCRASAISGTTVEISLPAAPTLYGLPVSLRATSVSTRRALCGGRRRSRCHARPMKADAR